MADDSETSIKIYLREIMQTPLLTAQREVELAARIKKGDQKARVWMIKANLRLVVKIAHDYSNLARWSVMKMRRRRSSCSETRTCATNLANFWKCWMTANARLS